MRVLQNYSYYFVAIFTLKSVIAESNHRVKCQEAYDKCKDEEPWFGIEQEYILLDSDLRPFGWPPGGFPPPQGPYYCGVGANKVFARDLVEAHYRYYFNTVAPPISK